MAPLLSNSADAEGGDGLLSFDERIRTIRAREMLRTAHHYNTKLQSARRMAMKYGTGPANSLKKHSIVMVLLPDAEQRNKRTLEGKCDSRLYYISHMLDRTCYIKTDFGSLADHYTQPLILNRLVHVGELSQFRRRPVLFFDKVKRVNAMMDQINIFFRAAQARVRYENLQGSGFDSVNEFYVDNAMGFLEERAIVQWSDGPEDGVPETYELNPLEMQDETQVEPDMPAIGDNEVVAPLDLLEDAGAKDEKEVEDEQLETVDEVAEEVLENTLGGIKSIGMSPSFNRQIKRDEARGPEARLIRACKAAPTLQLNFEKLKG